MEKVKNALQQQETPAPMPGSWGINDQIAELPEIHSALIMPKQFHPAILPSADPVPSQQWHVAGYRSPGVVVSGILDHPFPIKHPNRSDRLLRELRLEAWGADQQTDQA
jgi:hypothetical protein